MPQHATATRPRTAPVHPRRVSGPIRRPAPAGPAIPRGRTGVFERLSRLPDHYLVDRLLRSRLCIWVIGILLGGIVAMQVSLLRLNAGISRAVQTQRTLELQNAQLQTAIAEATSGERLRAAAADLSLVEPQAGQTRYLRARPDSDPARAARRMKPPSERAIAIMNNGGKDPTAAAAAGTAAAAAGTAATATTATGTAAAGTAAAPTTTAETTVAPVATATPVAPAATPVPTPEPIATPVTAAPDTGAAIAPAGQG